MLNLSTGAVSGVPTVVGSSAFTVRATRANCSGDADYSLEIAPGSITTIVASPNPVAAGQPLTLTATVSSQGEGTPTESVRFTINGLPVGGPISLVAGKATITTIVSGAAPTSFPFHRRPPDRVFGSWHRLAVCCHSLSPQTESLLCASAPLLITKSDRRQEDDGRASRGLSRTKRFGR
jgi:hypothetical protein